MSEKNIKPYSCPHCNERLPLISILLLSNKSILNCKNCNAQLLPYKMSDFHFIFSFVATAIPGFFFAKYFNSLIIGLSIGFLFGFVIYIIVVIYTYFNVKLIEI